MGFSSGWLVFAEFSFAIVASQPCPTHRQSCKRSTFVRTRTGEVTILQRRHKWMLIRGPVYFLFFCFCCSVGSLCRCARTGAHHFADVAILQSAISRRTPSRRHRRHCCRWLAGNWCLICSCFCFVSVSMREQATVVLSCLPPAALRVALPAALNSVDSFAVTINQSAIEVLSPFEMTPMADE